MKISELWGETVYVNPEQTKLFIQTWFHPDDLVTVGIIPQSSEQKALWMTWKARDLADISAEGLQELQEGIQGLYGLYVVVNPVKIEARIFPNGTSSKGGNDAIRETYGLFLDLDVKVGGFESQDQAIQFLDRLEVKPTMIVKNGEGGIHAWFRCDGATQDDMKAFHAYAQSKTEVAIDRLINLDRVLRLPGGIRYSATGSAGLTEIIGGTGQKVSLEAVRELSATPYAARKRQDQEVRNVSAKLMDGSVSPGMSIYWSMKDWADILIPAGWVQKGVDGEGRRVWSRPGKTRPERSATTDFMDGDCMSLLTSSEETGLADLKEADVPLTKARVALRLLANDDRATMLEIIKRR